MVEINIDELDTNYEDIIVTPDELSSLTDLIRENAVKYKVDFQEELCRVMIHGLLHLCGFKDKNVSDKEKMIDAENLALLNYNL